MSDFLRWVDMPIGWPGFLLIAAFACVCFFAGWMSRPTPTKEDENG